MNAKAKISDHYVLGISIAESPDLGRLGFSELHLRDYLIELSRYMLASGYTLAYGGDLREGGFSESLFDLVSTYKGRNGQTAPRIQSYLAWPLHLPLEVVTMAQLKSYADLHRMPMPEGADVDPNTFLEPDSPQNRHIWARSLTAMRTAMDAVSHARIQMGGKFSGFNGKYPGVVEEAMIALKNDTPTFLIGAFGGATGAVIRALKGEAVPELSADFQFQNADYAAMRTLYNAEPSTQATPIDYAALQAFFAAQGVAGLQNGLSMEENEVLFTSIQLPEIIVLILKGLRKLGLMG